MDKFKALHEYLRTATDRDTIHTDGQPLILHANDFFTPLDWKELPVQDWMQVNGGPLQTEFATKFINGTLSPEDCRRIGFREYTSHKAVIRRTIVEVAGTFLTAQLALACTTTCSKKHGQDGQSLRRPAAMACHTAGGTHHAHPSFGSGFTILNDLAITAHLLLSQPQWQVHKVLVIDCDVHQGDGTAAFRNATNALRDGLTTLSIHCQSNFPFRKVNGTYDIGLEDELGDDDYMQVLQTHIPKIVQEVQPDIILYDAGVDVYQHDSLGRLQLTLDGIRRRDAYILDYCCIQQGIPVAAVVGGGYDTDLTRLAMRHAIVHQEASRLWRKHELWKHVPTTSERGDQDLCQATTK